MKHCQYDYALRSHAIVDAVWEARDRRFAYIAKYDRESIWLGRNGVQGSLDLVHKV